VHPRTYSIISQIQFARN